MLNIVQFVMGQERYISTIVTYIIRERCKMHEALKRMERKGFQNTEHYKRLKNKLKLLEEGKAIKKDVTLECIASLGACIASLNPNMGGRFHPKEEMINETLKSVNRWKNNKGVIK